MVNAPDPSKNPHKTLNLSAGRQEPPPPQKKKTSVAYFSSVPPPFLFKLNFLPEGGKTERPPWAGILTGPQKRKGVARDIGEAPGDVIFEDEGRLAGHGPDLTLF